MRHLQTIQTSKATSLPERTVGDLVAERPGRSRVFQSFNIDFCCQGSRTLVEACQRKGISMEAVIERLEAEQAESLEGSLNPAKLPPAELAVYILETHHAFLRRELPRLHLMSDKVARVHGGHTPSLVEVFDVLVGLENELAAHMMKEEQILFPAIESLAHGKAESLPLDGPIACMLHEHDDAGAALAKLRELTQGYIPPVDACNTYRALFAGLKDLEEDLHKHIHLENNVLFPAALKMAA